MALNLTMQRVAANRYLAYLSGGVSGRTYRLQYVLEGVNMDWEYGGDFVADSAGKIITFELALPNLQYPSIFRWMDAVYGATSNTVTIDPLNPPPINGGGDGNGDGGGGGGAEAGFNVVSLIVVAILVFVLLAMFGGKKK